MTILNPKTASKLMLAVCRANNAMVLDVANKQWYGFVAAALEGGELVSQHHDDNVWITFVVTNIYTGVEEEFDHNGKIIGGNMHFPQFEDDWDAEQEGNGEPELIDHSDTWARIVKDNSAPHIELSDHIAKGVWIRENWFDGDPTKYNTLTEGRVYLNERGQCVLLVDKTDFSWIMTQQQMNELFANDTLFPV